MRNTISFPLGLLTGWVICTDLPLTSFFLCFIFWIIFTVILASFINYNLSVLIGSIGSWLIFTDESLATFCIFTLTGSIIGFFFHLIISYIYLNYFSNN